MKYICLNWRNTCVEAGNHTIGCKDWNKEVPGGEWTRDNDENHD